MVVNINCIYIDRIAWCKNKNVKRSLWGIGARYCMDYPSNFLNKNGCEFRVEHKRSSGITPPPPPKRKIREDIW
jgi:hypothetical protein